MRRTLCAWRSPALTGRDVNPPGGERPRSVSCLSRRRVVASRRQESISGSLCQISESSVSKARLLSESSWRRVVAAGVDIRVSVRVSIERRVVSRLPERSNLRRPGAAQSRGRAVPSVLSCSFSRFKQPF